MSRKNDVKQQHVMQALLQSFPELQTKRWRNAVAEAFADNEGDDGLPGELGEMLATVRLEPDAFSILKAEREVHFFEVEVHNPMSDDKLRQYARLQVDLDSHGVEFVVMVVNRHGHLNEVDLRRHYFDWLNRQQEASHATG